jgi:hypothetical protein
MSFNKAFLMLVPNTCKLGGVVFKLYISNVWNFQNWPRLEHVRSECEASSSICLEVIIKALFEKLNSFHVALSFSLWFWCSFKTQEPQYFGVKSCEFHQISLALWVGIECQPIVLNLQVWTEVRNSVWGEIFMDLVSSMVGYLLELKACRFWRNQSAISSWTTINTHATSI